MAQKQLLLMVQVTCAPEHLEPFNLWYNSQPNTKSLSHFVMEVVLAHGVLPYMPGETDS